MKPYVIKQGDYLTKLAFEKGFDAKTVWDDGKNADLKAKRGDPDTLRPGDVIFLPDREPKKFSFKKEADHAFKAKIPKVPLKATLSIGKKALADEPYVIKGLGEDIEGSTDGAGTIEIDPTLDVKEVEVFLPKRKRTVKLTVAGMDPIEEPSGARMRLQNLGYMGKKFSSGKQKYVEKDDDALRAALVRFQTEKGIEASGELDDATKDALKSAHGS